MTTAVATGSPPPIVKFLARNWSMMLVRGIFAILFAVVAIFWPGETLLTLVMIYGLYAIADGAVALVAAFRSGFGAHWWLALSGVAGIVFGALTFLWPHITALILLFMIAAWAIVIGVAQIAFALRLRKEIENEWMIVGSGVLSLLFGIAMFAAPGAGALALVAVIGAFAFAWGVMLLVFSLRLRKYAAPA
jgi:uncharacterized membrane protein HdeD (DUF308 family)